MHSSSTPLRRRDPESGYVLLAVIFMTWALLLTLAIAAPRIARSIQREKDIETIHRGEQYRRAIKLYYKKFGAYPTSVDQLVETNQIRFLRKRYTDPLTGKDDWKPILYGHAHVRPLGFFGQPLTATGLAGAAAAQMGGGISSGMYAPLPAPNVNGGSSSSSDTADNSDSSDNNDPWASGGSDSGTSPSGTSPSGSAAGGVSGSSVGFDASSSSSSGFGSSSDSGFGSSSSFGSSPGFGSSSGFGSSANSGFGSSGNSGFGSSANSGFGSSSTPGSGTSATTFGGSGTGPIVGFTLPVNKPSIVDYMEQTRYNKWEFNYDPMADQMQQAASLFGGAANINNSSSATSANSFGNDNDNSMGFGSNNGPGGSNSGFGNSNSGFGGSTTTNSGNSGTPQPQQPNSTTDNPQQ